MRTLEVEFCFRDFFSATKFCCRSDSVLSALCYLTILGLRRIIQVWIKKTSNGGMYYYRFIVENSEHR